LFTRCLGYVALNAFPVCTVTEGGRVGYVIWTINCAFPCEKVSSYEVIDELPLKMDTVMSGIFVPFIYLFR